jgi:hypothetical protein
VRQIKITSAAMDVVIVGNFSVSYQNANTVFSKTGTWFDYFGNNSITVTNVNESMLLAPGEFHIYTTVQQPAQESGLIDFVITSVDDVMNDSFSVYPNPVKDKSFMIQWSESVPDKVNIKVIDLLGRMIVNDHQYLMENTLQYNVESLPKGVYILTVEQHGVRKTQKILIE